MVTQFYHTRDPIANLRVRMTVRKIAAHGERDNDVPVGAVWSHGFQWQEKHWPFKNHKKIATKATLSDHEDAILSLGSSAHHGVALCSFVDADNFEPPRDPQHSETSLAPPSLSHDQKQTTRKLTRNRAALRMYREETVREMHLVLRIANHADEGEGKSEDLVLASLQFYPHTGLLCMTPGFSICIVDDKDVDAAKKGPKLSTYCVVSHTTGAQFEYALDNENELWPIVSSDDQLLLREFQRQEVLDDRARMNEWRNKHSDGSALELEATAPLSRVAATAKTTTTEEDQTMVLVEIVSVSGVESSDPIRVTVNLLGADNGNDPSGWKFCNGFQHSKTRLSRVTMSDTHHPIAAFGHHVPFVIARAKELETMHEVLPSLALSVVLQDNWCREQVLGHAEMRLPLVAGYTDTEVSLWRSVRGPQEQMEEIFLGCGVENAGHSLTSAIAVDASKGVLSRLGVKTESTGGRVRVRLHVVHSRPQAVRPPTSTASLSLAGTRVPQGGGGSVLKRSVDEILQAVKSSQHRSSVARNTALPPLPLPLSSVTEILARLKDQQSNRGMSPSAG